MIRVHLLILVGKTLPLKQKDRYKELEVINTTRLCHVFYTYSRSLSRTVDQTSFLSFKGHFGNSNTSPCSKVSFVQGEGLGVKHRRDQGFLKWSL